MKALEIAEKVMAVSLGHDDTCYILVILNLPDDFNRYDVEQMRYARSQLVSWFTSSEGAEFANRIALPKNKPFSTLNLSDLASCAFYSGNHQIREWPNQHGENSVEFSTGFEKCPERSLVTRPNIVVLQQP